MPVPVEQRIKFFVFVLESPSANDLYHRRSEGELIRQAVELNQIQCVVKTVISRPMFEACLQIGLAQEAKLHPDCIPLLHISAHGSTEGIQLSDGYTMSWHELREHLHPVNKALGGYLIVCMSSCQGYWGTQMAMYPDDPDLPYFALVGCGGAPTWAETAVGFATFYHQLYRGEHVAEAVKVMASASGNGQFWIEHAQQTRQNYIELLRERASAAKVQANLQQLESNTSPEVRDAMKAGTQGWPERS